MKFIDDIFQLYKDELVKKAENTNIILESILEELSYTDVNKLIKEATDEERYEMFALYIYEMLHLKLGYQIPLPTNGDGTRRLH